MSQPKAYAIDFAPFIKERTSNFIGRDWVFGRIDAWLGQKDAGRVFLLTGEPGSGKTAIAARLAQFSAGEAEPPAGLQKLGPGFLAAVHFCSATASDWTDPRTFARSISLQLASIPEFALALKDVGDKEINIDVQQETGDVADGAAVTGVLIQNLVIRGLSGQEAFNRTVLDPLRTIYNAGYDKPIVMVVDSLDEALASATDVTVVDLLAGLQGLDSRVRLILTSRAEPRVENRFFVASGLFLSDPDYTADNDRDILEYVTHRLTSDDSLKSKVAALTPAQAAALPDQITGKAEGNFLYGVFLLNAAAEGQQALDALDTLPSGLDGLYYSFLERIVRLGKKDWTAVYKPVLGVLSVAQEPITLAQVRAYTGLPGDDAWDILLDLRQFVEVSPAPSPTNGDEEPEDRYRLYHQSVGDFLRRRQIVTVVDGQKKRYDDVYRVMAEDWQKRIVATYRGDARSWEEVEWSQCDDYGLAHLPAQLSGAGSTAELNSLLLVYRWLQAKLDRLGVNALLADFTFSHPAIDGAVRGLGNALEQAAHVLAENSAQLASQLFGRLLSDPARETQKLLDQARRQTQRPWLRPITCSLADPQALLRTLAGHADAVSGVTVTLDGRLAVSASYDRTLKVWDLVTGVELNTLAGHTEGIYGVAVTPDGRLAVSASEDNTLKTWDLASGHELCTLKGHTSRVFSTAVTPDGSRAVSASGDTTLKVWDLASGQELCTLTGHTGDVNGVAVTPDCNRAVSASADHTLRVWDLVSGKELSRLTGHTRAVYSVAVTPDGSRAVSASADTTLKVWDLARGVELYTLTGHAGWVYGVAVTPDGSRVVSASDDKTIKIWDLRSGVELFSLTGHTDGIYSVTLTTDGSRMVSASKDRTLRVWNLASWAELRTLTGHTDKVIGVTLTPDGHKAVSASWDNTLKVWDLATGGELCTFAGHRRIVTGVVVTPDGRLAVSASWDNTLKIWDLSSGQELRTLTGHTFWVTVVAVTPDGSRAVSASYDEFKVWDLRSGAELYTLTGHSGNVEGVAVTPDGNRAVSASADNTLKVWDLVSGQELRALTGHTQVVHGVVVTPDGNRAVSASADCTLKVWDLVSGREVRTLTGHTGAVYGVAVTPDGRRAASASADSTLRVWDLLGGRELRTLTGHTETIHGIALTPDVRRAVSASADHTLKVWDLANGACLATFFADGSLDTCAVTPDGPTVVAAGASGRMHFLRWEE